MCRHGRRSRTENHIQLSAASTPSDIQADTFTGHQMCKHMVLLVSVESKQRETMDASEHSLKQTQRYAGGRLKIDFTANSLFE